MAILGRISDKEYNELKEVRNSDLSEIDESYAHYKDRKNKKKTDSMIFGSAFHCYLLDGKDEFFKQYKVFPQGFDKKSDARKREWNDCIEAGLIPLKYDDLLAIMKMKDNVMAHPVAKNIFKTSENEGAYTGVIEDVDVKCKVDVRSRGYTFDVKTCASASKSGFKKSIDNFDLHRQGAFYDEILRQNGIISEGFGHIAVENEEPHMVAVYILDEKSMITGMSQAVRLLKKLKKYKSDPKLWDGYTEQIESIGISGWKAKQEEDMEENHTGA